MQVLIIFLITAQIYRKSSIKKSVIFAQNWTWNRSWRYSQEPKIWNEHGNFFNEYVNDSFRVSHFSSQSGRPSGFNKTVRMNESGRSCTKLNGPKRFTADRPTNWRSFVYPDRQKSKTAQYFWKHLHGLFESSWMKVYAVKDKTGRSSQMKVVVPKTFGVKRLILATQL